MDDKKKKFMIPDAEIVNFTNEDIITISGRAETLGDVDDAADDDFERLFPAA